MQLRNFFKETYGSGTQLTSLSSAVIFFSLTAISLTLYFLIDPTKIDNGLPILLNQIVIYYISLFLFGSGFFILALFLYCKPIPMKDRFKYVKIVFVFLSLLFFAFLFLPYIVFNFINDNIGKIFKIKRLTHNIVAALFAILTWISLFYIMLIVLTFVSDIVRFYAESLHLSLVTVVNASACVYYSVFISILISNNIARIVFFKISPINDEEKKKSAKHQITIFWHYTIFALSFIAKPLNFSDPGVKLFFDALFYASATLSLLSKAIETKNKIV
ncbi:hypothetical protein P5G60_17205 [Paenibacillus jamilae]|nr:hypothetical protein [Paenibacillus jamilae]